ncbi:MAG: MBL fold metallo-hydrolase [Tateyamaria sp.]|jgi:glyoxylase-like metal-dependent hydrolase (beta-lactamase superfamily II)|nr:MBL fold metallo-hydrolase [Tateyamaria sp.]
MTAEMKGPLRAPVHRFVLGEVEITSILDGTFPMGISPPFLLEESDDEVARIAYAASLPTDQLENNFVPVLVNTGDALILIDTGFGQSRRETGAGFLRPRLAEAGYAPEDIDIVALTHAHPDHIGGLWEGGELAFPNAELLIGKREFDAWKSGDGIPEQRTANREMFLKVVAPLEDRFRFLEDGDEIAKGVFAEAAFGHSLGHMMFRVKSAGEQALIWGDVANHYVFSVGHPGSKVGFDDDKDMALATRERVLADTADSGVLVIGHHMPFPGVGYVKRADGTFRWVPAAYQIWI